MPYFLMVFLLSENKCGGMVVVVVVVVVYSLALKPWLECCFFKIDTCHRTFLDFMMVLAISCQSD